MMRKSIIGAGFFWMLLSGVVISDTGVSCAAPGICNYQDQGDGTLFYGNRGAPSGGSRIITRPGLPDPCTHEKGKIDREHAQCNYNSALDNGREISRCSTLSNSGWSWGGSVGYHVVFFNATYTIENPTYDKCINQVAAAFTSATAYCALKYVENKNIARTALGGRCANSFQ